MENSVWMVVLSKGLIPVIVAVVTPVLVSLAHRLIGLFERKLDVDVSEKRERKILELVDEGIHYAEEQARKAMKGEETDVEKTFGSAEKMETAVEYVEKRAGELGVDELVEKSGDRLASIIEARLFQKRLESGDA